MATAHMHEYGHDEETDSRVAVKNHKNGALTRTLTCRRK